MIGPNHPALFLGASLFFLSLTSPAFGGIVIKVREHSDTGVKSEIRRIHANSDETSLGETNGDGDLILKSETCKLGERLKALPKSDDFFPSEEVCDANLTIVVRSKRFAGQLLKTGNGFYSGNEFGKAALYYFVASDQTKFRDVSLFKESNGKMCDSLAAFFKASKKCALTSDGMVSLGGDLEQRYKKYQTEAGLEATGYVDRQTLYKMSGGHKVEPASAAKP